MLTVFKFCTYYLGDLPMKFLHLADLHLGKRVNGFDLLEDQRYILEQILALCDSNKVDAVVLAGDIYDAPVPPAAACTLLDWFLTQLAARRIAVLAVSGNHDSAERLDYAAGLLANQNVYIAGQFRGAPRQIVLNDRFGPVEFTLLPFVRAATVRHYMPEADLPDYDSAVAAALSACAPSAERRVLVAHQMVVAGLCPPQLSGSETAPLTVGTVDSVDAAHFAGFSYTALGHIHRAQRVGSDTVRYAGAPLCYHLDECGMEKSATLVRLGRRGVDGIDTLPQLIAQKLQKHKRVLVEPAQRPVIVENIPIRRESEFRAWLPIMYGCDNFCTYCIVPYVRGREKSRKPGDILAEFKSLVEAGYKEITLLGQNVNSYGKGLEEQVDFADLLNLLCTVPGDYHIRFMTSHPKDASFKLIDTIAAQPKICKHLHLPVQCGSDRLLVQMNRHYTVEHYLELIEYARKKVPGITFSSDIIVGFPGETEEDFQKTLELVQKVGYMQLFTFIYSKRTGTKAADMPDPTPRKEKTDRMTRLLKVQDDIAMALVKAQVGQTVRVLVEGYGRNEGTLSGRLDNNLTVEFKADPALMGSYAMVRLTGARATVLLGELVE